MTTYCKRKECGHEQSEHTERGCVHREKDALGQERGCMCNMFQEDFAELCTCVHAPEEHVVGTGCRILGCSCTWEGTPAKPASVPPVLKVVQPLAETAL